MNRDITSTDVNAALGRLAASGLFAPWRGDKADTSKAEVAALWARQARARDITGRALLDAVDRYLDALNPGANGRNFWPTPADVLLHAAKSTTTHDRPSCGHCSPQGLRTVAWHHSDTRGQAAVSVSAVHCDCDRGRYWAGRRGEPLKGETSDDRRPAIVLHAFLRDLENRANHLAAYVDPEIADTMTASQIETMRARIKAKPPRKWAPMQRRALAEALAPTRDEGARDGEAW